MIFGAESINYMRDEFLKTESSCREIISEEAHLGFLEKILRSLIKIFAPLL